MKRYVGYVEEIDWSIGNCRVRIPCRDGIQNIARIDPTMAILLQLNSQTKDLQTANIPYHLRGLRLGDIVLLLDSEDDNDELEILGFYGGVSEN